MFKNSILIAIFAALLTGCDSAGTGLALPKSDIECYSSDGLVIYSAVNVGPVYGSDGGFRFRDNDGHSVRISGHCIVTDVEG